MITLKPSSRVSAVELKAPTPQEQAQALSEPLSEVKGAISGARILCFNSTDTILIPSGANIDPRDAVRDLKMQMKVDGAQNGYLVIDVTAADANLWNHIAKELGQYNIGLVPIAPERSLEETAKEAVYEQELTLATMREAQERRRKAAANSR